MREKKTICMRELRSQHHLWAESWQWTDTASDSRRPDNKPIYCLILLMLSLSDTKLALVSILPCNKSRFFNWKGQNLTGLLKIWAFQIVSLTAALRLLVEQNQSGDFRMSSPWADRWMTGLCCYTAANHQAETLVILCCPSLCTLIGPENIERSWSHGAITNAKVWRWREQRAAGQHVDSSHDSLFSPLFSALFSLFLLSPLMQLCPSGSCPALPLLNLLLFLFPVARFLHGLHVS